MPLHGIVLYALLEMHGIIAERWSDGSRGFQPEDFGHWQLRRRGATLDINPRDNVRHTEFHGAPERQGILPETI
jgi:hypothetical protein